MITKKCLICGKKFQPDRNSKGKYCSYKCYWLSLKGKIINPKNGKYVKCQICGKEFYVSKCRIDKTEFCSNKCRGISLKNKRLSIKTEFKKGQISWTKGKKFPERSGKNNVMWKGDFVSYSGLHYWIKRCKGKPEICEHCGKPAKHWANIDHKYRRNLDDYISLCASCHKKYDIKNNLNHLPHNEIHK